MAGAGVLEFSSTTFQDDVLSSAEPVLVDFWAPWCSPCRMLAPTIDALATEFTGKVRVGKLDTDKNQDIAQEYGISSIPTVLIFKGGKIVGKFVGVTPKDKLATSLNEQLA